MFGTRASAVVDFTFAVTLLAPIITLLSLRAVRGRNYDRHRKMQVVLLSICLLAVIALEIEIRLAGGSGALLAQSAAGRAGLARAFLAAHITGAVVTYLVWAGLAIASWRRYRAALPGAFSRTHRRIGKWIFGGLCFTALTAVGMYTLAFVA